MKQQVLTRLKSVSGQINGIVKMIEEDKECLDIITQLKAARAGLKKVNNLIAEESLNKCLGKDLSTKEQTEIGKLLAELSD